MNESEYDDNKIAAKKQLYKFLAGYFVMTIVEIFYVDMTYIALFYIF